jgi:hypothetical protein
MDLSRGLGDVYKRQVEKHASRKTITRSKAVSRKADNTQQLGFDF